MELINKILLIAPDRRGRLRDYRYQRVPTSRLLRNAPRALYTWLRLKLLGKFSNRPWIAYDGQARIDEFLTKDKSVLEFGGGMSTIWYARRAGRVVSLEDDATWFDRTGAMLAKFDNVEHRLCSTLDQYLLADMPADETFDFIMIDGTQRFECLKAALPRLRDGGLLYLDNSDMHGDDHTGNIPAARQMLLDYAAENNFRIDRITDFAPTQLFVNEATLLYKTPAT